MKVATVVLNWNGASIIEPTLRSLKNQTIATEIVVVDNASTDNSVELIEKKFADVTLLKNRTNLGFAGGVNTGIRYALDKGFDYVALLNNDAVAEKNWLKHLVEALDKDSKVGIATCKFLRTDKKTIDSTGDFYTIWGLPFPRGRDQEDSGQFDKPEMVFGASGGASLYRAKMLKQIGLFDEDFFAYYEDVDISFRAQLAGWKVAYVTKAEAYHMLGATNQQVKGLATYQTLKNLPLLLWKNVPWALMLKVYPRFVIAWWAIGFSALHRGQIWPFVKAIVVGGLLWPKKLWQRRKIQKNRQVSIEHISSIIDHDLPPNARKLRRLRNFVNR
ncbi:hypothetical protein A3F65_00655 [Candidatus Saccharibacteria bacterium RIFCSPHIGHO2_12_FULL_47_16b]|nr:MAG: hypothetical protein A3F65_00655 [Candidatus Saccharibacteria bacterium RIFCSPHIGHO2_12_FULL_47_16b]